MTALLSVRVTWEETYERHEVVDVDADELAEWLGGEELTPGLVQEFLQAGRNQQAWHPGTEVDPYIEERIDVRLTAAFPLGVRVTT